MKVSYYPGCSLHGTAWEFDSSLKSVCAVLGIEPEEVEDWNCCGASSAHSFNEKLSILLPARNLAIAEKAGYKELLVPCAACYNRCKNTHKFYEQDDSLKETVPYNCTLSIKHVNEFFAHKDVLETVKQHVKKPLNGLKVVPYYGCLTVRHPKVIMHPNPEDPTEMDEILEVLGAGQITWSYKTDCCGGSLMMTRADIVRKLSGDLFDAAAEAGAEAIVTDCPLCQANLDTREDEIAKERDTDYNLPVFYITELMGIAVGCTDSDRWWGKHMVDPRPLLRARNLI